MRAIIPVAGIGTRLKPHTYSTPKVLLNVGGKPILAHILDKLIEEGIKKIFGRKGEKIVQLNLDALKAGREFALDQSYSSSI